MTKQIVTHANMIVVYGAGVLITGPPKIGKSEITLALIDRGHHFISDDATQLSHEAGQLIASCPAMIHTFMQIDAVGVVNIKKLFGKRCCKQKHRVDIGIALKQFDEMNMTHEPLEPQIEPIDMLGVTIPTYALPVTVGKQLPLLIEVLVRNFKLKSAGYSAAQTLRDKQHQAMNKET